MGHNGDGVGARKRRGHLGPSTRVPCVPLGRSNLNLNQITPEGAHEGAQRERNGHQLSTRHHTDQPARSAAPVQKPTPFKSEVEGAQWTPLCCSQLEKAQGGFPLFRAPSSSAGPRPADLFLDPPAVPPPPDR